MNYELDLRNGRMHVNRAKGGIESVHPLHGPELRALRPLQGNSPYVFTTEAGTPVTTAWFLRMVQLRSYPFQCIRTCCDMRLGSSWRMMATIRGAWRIISDIVGETISDPAHVGRPIDMDQ